MTVRIEISRRIRTRNHSNSSSSNGICGFRSASGIYAGGDKAARIRFPLTERSPYMLDRPRNGDKWLS